MAFNFLSHYKFDANSNDSIGTNNGTDTNISYVAWIKWNGASFNGVSSLITTGYTNSSDLQWVSVWLNPSSTGTDRAIVWNGSGAANFQILVNNLGKISVRDQWGTFWNETGTSVANGSWQHFIFTLRKVEAPPWIYNTYVDIYKNNSFIQTITTGWWSSETWFWSWLRIWRHYTTNYYYSWIIDHLTFWNWTLSASERTYLYNWWIPPDIPFQSNFFPLF